MEGGCGSLMHDDDGCGFLFVLRERPFLMGFLNWDHANYLLSGIKKCPLVGGLLYTSTIVISIGVIASVLCIEVVRWWEGPLWEVPLYFLQFVHIAIFMSLHGPAGACILVASVSPIHVFPIQLVLRH